MTWVKLDDAFWRHRKVRKAWKEPRAVGAYVMALCHCNEENAVEENDGFVDEDWLVMIVTDKAERARVAAKLVEVGLWAPATGGWMIHDYLEYQPSHKKVFEVKEARRIAGALGGKAGRANGSQGA